MKKTLYTLLGVDSLADQELIEQAYRIAIGKLEAQSTHGDPEVQNQIFLVKEAYRTLSIPEKRAEYDRKLNEETTAANTPIQPVTSYPYQEDTDSVFMSWWHTSKTSVVIAGVFIVLLTWLCLGYLGTTRTAEVLEKAIDESAKVQEMAITSQSDDRDARELQRQEQRARDLELQQEREHARQYEQRRREEQRAEQRSEYSQTQKAESEKRKEEYARQQREREANMRAERERRYYTCLNPAIDQYGVQRAQELCANYR